MAERYRVHFIITAAGFERPRSFRTEAYADSALDAAAKAEEYVWGQPLTELQVLKATIEKVPE